jgi:2-hydroxychromene-2-carboxylate isomerase
VPPSRLTWYFDFVSPFSYLQLAGNPDIFERPDVALVPVLFAGLLRHFDNKGPAEIAPKRLHTYRYTQWQATQIGVPMRYPAGHPFNSLHALRCAVALDATYDAVRRIFAFIWGEGRSPEDEKQALAAALGGAAVEERATTDEVKARLRANTDDAARLGVFGVPTFVADGHLFWGLDATGMLRDYLANPALFTSPEMARLESLPFASVRKR